MDNQRKNNNLRQKFKVQMNVLIQPIKKNLKEAEVNQKQISLNTTKSADE